MAKLTCLLRGLAKEGLIPRAYFDTSRSIYECCASSDQFGLGQRMVPSTWLKIDGEKPDTFLFESKRDPVTQYRIDPDMDIEEYYFITKVDLDEVKSSMNFYF